MHLSDMSPFKSWLQRGIQLGFLQSVRIAPHEKPSPWQFFALFVLGALISVALGRFIVKGEATFYAWALLPSYVFLAFSAFVFWAGFQFNEAGSEQRHAAIKALCLYQAASIPIALLAYFAQIFVVQGSGWLGAATKIWLPYVVYWLAFAWFFLVILRIAHALSMRVWPAFAVASALVCFSLLSHHFWPISLWYPKSGEEASSQPLMKLSQEQFESQNQLLQTQLEMIAPQREGMRDVFVLTYAPYAPENVFWKESDMVRSVIGQRYGASSRGISLLNNPSTTATHAWATPLNLQRALQAIAAKMDREQDVLLLYLTSHGAKDFKLASSHWPLDTEQLTPQQLAQMLNASGIKHRIIAVSACYSGGWIDPLKTEHSLVMTAADATHTSYGCGTRSELTFFGRAVFDEQLRSQTRSFEQAFAAAVPIIKKREEEAGKEDGFSNPQIFVGDGIRATLKDIEKTP
jgi:hypothetical protein